MAKNNNNTKRNYTVLQNSIYALKNLWNWDKCYFVALVPQIILSVFMPLVVLYYPNVLINLIIKKESDAHIVGVITLYSLLLVIMGVIQVCVSAKINSTRHTFSIKYQSMCDIKSKTMDYEKLEDPKISNMERQSYGGSIAAENIVGAISQFFVNILGILTYGSIIVQINPIILLLLVISTTVNYLMISYVRIWNDKNREKWTHLDRRISYLFDVSQDYERAKDIRVYNMNSWLIGLINHYQKLRMAWSQKSWNKSIISTLLDGLLRFIRDGVAYAILINMLLNNDINVGSFVFFFGAITGFSEWLSSIIGQYNIIASHSNDINQLRVFLEMENKFTRDGGIPLPDTNQPARNFVIKDLNYQHVGSEIQTIHNMNITIEKGEKIAVVGINGAGKTTLVKLLSSLYYPTSGDIFFDGCDIKKFNIDEYYTQFSIVFQEVFMIPVTIAQFVSGNGENIDREKVQHTLYCAGLKSLINKLEQGIDTILVKGIYDDGIDLSGGEKQKLLLARALYKDAPVIILDEPTAALDPIAESELYQKYNSLTLGKTSIYISHRLASTKFCDRILFIENGVVTECGSHEELMQKNGSYANMYNIQSSYYKGEKVDDAK